MAFKECCFSQNTSGWDYLLLASFFCRMLFKFIYILAASPLLMLAKAPLSPALEEVEETLLSHKILC